MSKREAVWIVELGKVSLHSPNYHPLSKVSYWTLGVPGILLTVCTELQSTDLEGVL